MPNPKLPISIHRERARETPEDADPYLAFVRGYEPLASRTRARLVTCGGRDSARPALAIGLLTVLATGACAASPARAPDGPTVSAPGQRGRPVDAERREIPRESLDRLASEVEALATGPSAEHGGVVSALRRLADAIELLPDAPQRSVEAIREAARRVEGLDATAPSQADPVKQGLSAALQALVTRAGPAGRELEYQRAVRGLTRAIDALNDNGSRSEQPVAAAFRAAADAVLLAAGGEAAFGEAESGGSDAAQDTSVESAVDEARAEVLKLGQTGWIQSRHASSRALSALADVVEVLDRPKALAHKVSDIRFQAERVRYADSLAFGRAGWIKAGLSSALDALDGLCTADGLRLPTWTRAARHAVSGVDRESLAFQRAAVQDAFRATVDAFVAGVQLGACR